jgi:hypothetical protein
MPEKAICSRVTIIDRATLYVTESSGDFASTVLEEVVNEHVPGYTHNPPTVIVLEHGFNESRADDLPLLEPTPLARAIHVALLDDIARECGRATSIPQALRAMAALEAMDIDGAELLCGAADRVEELERATRAAVSALGRSGSPASGGDDG